MTSSVRSPTRSRWWVSGGPLVVRELLSGPKRYTDLVNGLPGIGTNILAARLKDLEEVGVVRKEAAASGSLDRLRADGVRRRAQRVPLRPGPWSAGRSARRSRATSSTPTGAWTRSACSTPGRPSISRRPGCWASTTRSSRPGSPTAVSRPPAGRPRTQTPRSRPTWRRSTGSSPVSSIPQRPWIRPHHRRRRPGRSRPPRAGSQLRPAVRRPRAASGLEPGRIEQNVGDDHRARRTCRRVAGVIATTAVAGWRAAPSRRWPRWRTSRRTPLPNCSSGWTRPRGARGEPSRDGRHRRRCRSHPRGGS